VDDSDDGDDHKEELRVEEDAEGLGCVCGVALAYSMRGHKPNHRDEYGTCENVMNWICFWDVDYTEYPDEESDDDG